MPRLDIQDLHAGYGTLEVLHEVNIAVPERAAVGLLGANGAGKTTLLKVASGLLPRTSGRILLDGKEIQSWSSAARVRSGICLIPEGRAIFRRLSVRENLAMQVEGRNVEEAIERATNYFPVLGRRLEQRAGTLSGGEQQMLAVSRALVTDAPIVMVDELSIGLAPIVVDEIFAAIKQLVASGRSLLMVEQYVERALEIVDYVYILHKGNIVFLGEPAQVRGSDVLQHYLGQASEAASAPASRAAPNGGRPAKRAGKARKTRSRAAKA